MITGGDKAQDKRRRPHDADSITMTKTVIMSALGLALAAGVVLLKTWPLLNDVETGKTPEYPDLRPVRYQTSQELVLDAALHAVHALPRWLMVSYDRQGGHIRAEATSRLFRFVDDVTINVAEDAGGALVTVRSASRIGRGDFGQNARNIRAFLAELDRAVERQRAHHPVGRE